VNDMEDEKQDESEALASGERHEDPGLRGSWAFQLAAWGRGQHMHDTSHSPWAQQVFQGHRPSHGSELPAIADRDSLEVLNRSDAGEEFLK
jgi:hypothetical protein